MSFRFRKSLKLAPGVRLNVNKKSASITAGVKGAHITKNTNGQTTTSIGAPGTGISYVSRHGSSSQPHQGSYVNSIESSENVKFDVLLDSDNLSKLSNGALKGYSDFWLEAISSKVHVDDALINILPPLQQVDLIVPEYIRRKQSGASTDVNGKDRKLYSAMLVAFLIALGVDIVLFRIIHIFALFLVGALACLAGIGASIELLVKNPLVQLPEVDIPAPFTTSELATADGLFRFWTTYGFTSGIPKDVLHSVADTLSETFPEGTEVVTSFAGLLCEANAPVFRPVACGLTTTHLAIFGDGIAIQVPCEQLDSLDIDPGEIYTQLTLHYHDEAAHTLNITVPYQIGKAVHRTLNKAIEYVHTLNKKQQS